MTRLLCVIVITGLALGSIATSARADGGETGASASHTQPYGGSYGQYYGGYYGGWSYGR